MNSDNITNDMFLNISNDNDNDNISLEALSWLKKYSPNSFDECLIKSEEKNKMDNWLKHISNAETDLTLSSKKSSSKSKTKSSKKNEFDTNCLFLYGPPGIGKTTIANLLLKKYNYDILEFNASDTRTAKTIRENLNQVSGSHNVIDFMCNKKTKIAIILDEIDGLSNGDKGGMTEINNIIAECREKKTPFVCISNTVCKKTDSLKRKSLFIKVSKPSDLFIKKIVTKIDIEEELHLDQDIINSIIKKSQGDIRRCVTLVEYIFRNKKKEQTSKPNIFIEISNKNDDKSNGKQLDLNENQLEIIENYSRKLTELAPYEMCEKILNSSGTLGFFLQNFNFDHSMTNWYIYENFVKYIDKNRIASFDKKINNIDEIYDCFIQGDIFEKEVVHKQIYEFYEYINIIKTHGASYWANKGLKRSCYNKMGMMNYSTLLNRTSLEYSNSKNWKHINNVLLCNQDTNITTELCNIFFKNLENDNKEFINEFIKKYNFELDDFEKILKMSIFYNKSQPQILTNLKKKIKLYYNSSE